MKFFPSALTAALLTLVASPVIAADALLPQFEHLFTGSFGLDPSSGVIQGPYGQRLLAPLISGSLSTPNGTLAATFLPGSAEIGINTFNAAANDTIFTEVNVPVKWAVDGTFAYLRIQGVGIVNVGAMSSVHLETDSPTYVALNRRFMVVNVTLPSTPDSLAHLDIFGLVGGGPGSA